jgi:hypothetical protein
LIGVLTGGRVEGKVEMYVWSSGYNRGLDMVVGTENTIKKIFSNSADIQNTFFFREGEEIPISVNAHLNLLPMTDHINYSEKEDAIQQ